MAQRFKLRLYKGPSGSTMRQVMSDVALSLGGAITWSKPASGVQDLRMAHVGDVHTLDIPYQGGIEFLFCKDVGSRLGGSWLELRIQEGSIWDYALYRGGKMLDKFSVCPQFWEGGELDAKEMEAWKGKPAVLAEAWGLPVDGIRNYLVNWGYRNRPDTFDFELKGKAYSTDEHSYGNYEQFFDVLNVLGGKEPMEQHTIVLPATAPS